jgi:hypothetical protein
MKQLAASIFRVLEEECSDLKTKAASTSNNGAHLPIDMVLYFRRLQSSIRTKFRSKAVG